LTKSHVCYKNGQADGEKERRSGLQAIIGPPCHEGHDKFYISLNWSLEHPTVKMWAFYLPQVTQLIPQSCQYCYAVSNKYTVESLITITKTTNYSDAESPHNLVASNQADY